MRRITNVLGLHLGNLKMMEPQKQVRAPRDMGSGQDRSGFQSSRCGFDPSSAQLQNQDLTAQMLPKQQNTGATRATGDRNSSCSRLLIQWILHWALTERLLWAGLPWGSDSDESTCDAGDMHSIPGSGRSPAEGNGNPLQCSCLENPMDRRAWRATVHGVTKSRTQLSS